MFELAKLTPHQRATSDRGTQCGDAMETTEDSSGSFARFATYRSSPDATHI